MSSKRTSLDAVLPTASTPTSEESNSTVSQVTEPDAPQGKRPHVKQQTLYLPIETHRQLRLLAFTEEVKQHDLLLEAVSLLFQSRGLPTLNND